MPELTMLTCTKARTARIKAFWVLLYDWVKTKCACTSSGGSVAYSGTSSKDSTLRGQDTLSEDSTLGGDDTLSKDKTLSEGRYENSSHKGIRSEKFAPRLESITEEQLEVHLCALDAAPSS